MVETLRREWKPEMPWEEVIVLRDHLDCMLREIRLSQGIRPPSMWCPVCNRQTQQAPPTVSVRALVLALGRFGIVVQPNSSRWRSAGQSTGRKTALIEMVSPTRQYPRVPTLRGRTVIRTILSHDDTSAPSGDHTRARSVTRGLSGWRVYRRRQRAPTEIGCRLLGRWAAAPGSVWRREDC